MSSAVFEFGKNDSHVRATPHTFVARKTQDLWALIVGMALDPAENHVAAGLRILVNHYPDRDHRFQQMLLRLERRKPTVCSFEYEDIHDPTLAVVDKAKAKNKIVVNLRMGRALEEAGTSY